MHLFPGLLSSVLLLGVSRAETPPVALLRPGEALTYQVDWGLLGHTGDLKVTATADPFEGMDQTRVTTTSSTRGIVRAIYPFNGDAQMLFDARDGRLLRAIVSSDSGRERTKTSIVFDYAKSEAAYVDYLHPGRNALLPLPAGRPRPMDLVTGLLQTRAWALKPGESRDVLVVFDNEFYPLRISAEREETIQTATGPIKTVLLIPRMIGSPKGMFRRNGTVRVWVSDDADRLPVRFEVRLKIGTARAVLTDYRAPASD